MALKAAEEELETVSAEGHNYSELVER